MADEIVKGLWRVDGPAELTASVVAKLGLRLAESPGDAEWILVREGELWRLEDREGRKLRIDFDAPGPDYRRRALKGKAEIIARALGSGKGVRRVIDLSAGLGQDAVFLSQLGFEVTAVERHPVLEHLLNEANARTKRAELSSLRFVQGDSAAIFTRPDFDGFEAAYFDPMYPTKRKSALPRQEMVLFRGLVGTDGDAEKVATEALKHVPRLAIKRPDEAPPLLPNPSASFRGTTVRYDVYSR